MMTITEAGETVDGRVIATRTGRENVHPMAADAGVAIVMETEITEPGETIPMIKPQDGEKVLLTPSPVVGEGIAVTAARHPLILVGQRHLRFVFPTQYPGK